MAKHYTTLQEIYEEAGLSHAVHREAADGLADGSNKVFTVNNKPLVDSNYDDKVNADDIKVYVDGTPATVASVDTAFGSITLEAAPAAEAEVTIDYHYSSASMTYVEKLRAEAEQTINSRMKRVGDCVPYGEGDKAVPAIASGLARQFAAAWLLIREYGYNQDIEDTSKDGYKRLETVKQALEDYANSGGECAGDDDDGGASGLGSFATASDGDLFPQPNFSHDRHRHSDDWAI